MDLKSLRIVACPDKWRYLALRIALRELPEAQQAAIEASAGDAPGLFVALAGNLPVGACWAQPQPGNTAVLWPPQLVDADAQAADLLLIAAVDYLDRAGVGLTQTLHTDRRDPAIALLERHGFTELASLVFLSWERNALVQDDEGDHQGELYFEPYRPAEEDRLAALVEQTYIDTLDCPLLNGVRDIDDVMAGYRATGEYRPELWNFVRCDDRDVGVLLLAIHPEIHHLELMYMGIVPSARGRGFGTAIVRRAQRETAAHGCDRLVLAVDTQNQPAMMVYHKAGFRPWDRRLVYFRPARGTAATRG